jgi:hypothetical protein
MLSIYVLQGITPWTDNAPVLLILQWTGQPTANACHSGSCAAAQLVEALRCKSEVAGLGLCDFSLI